MWMWIILLGSAGWVLYDAKKIGVKKGLISGLGNMGPWAWFFATLFLWIIAFPMYLIKRGDFIKALERERSNSSVAAPAKTKSNSSLANLEKLAELKTKGILSEEEFQAKKKELLGG
jgi:hypothetical protein